MGTEWEWVLHDGTRVKAESNAQGVESVWREGRLLSRSAPGGKANGHTFVLPPQKDDAYRQAGHAGEMNASFDGRKWTLTLDGRSITPQRTAPASAAPSPTKGGGNVSWKFVVGCLVVGIITAVISLRAYDRRATAALPSGQTKLTQITWTDDHAIQVSYPSDFVLRPINHGLELSRRPQEEYVVLISVVSRATPDEQQKVMEGYVELLRTELASKGVVLGDVALTSGLCRGANATLLNATGTLQQDAKDQVKLWGCLFLSGGRAFMFSYSVPVAFAARDESLLRTMVDAAVLGGGPVFAPVGAPAYVHTPLEAGPGASADLTTRQRRLAGRIVLEEPPPAPSPAPPPPATVRPASSESAPNLSDAERERRMRAARAANPW